MVAATLTLFEDQIPAVEEVRAAFEDGHTKVLLQGATGWGKTTIFTYIGYHSGLMGYTVHIIVHRDELITQVCKRLEQYGYEYGVIAAGYPESPWAKIQVCSVQTYNIRMKKDLIKAADLYVVDEAHHASASTYVDIWEFAPDAHFLGVTATPKRTDGHGLDFYEVEIKKGVKIKKPLFTKIICGPPIRYLIDAGRLVEPWHYAPSAPLDTSMLTTRDGDWVKAEVVELLSKSGIHGDAITAYKEHCPDTPAVAFCVNRKHCHMVAKEFNDAGIRAEVIDGTMKKWKRRQLVQQFDDGLIQVLCSANLITEGFDLPKIGAVFLLRLSKSIIYYLQCVGRGIRADEGKDRCYVFDHVRFIDQPGFGMVDSARRWSLEGTVINLDEEGVKACDVCDRWVRQSVEVCPGCGTPFKKDERESTGGGGSRNIDYSANKVAEMKRYLSEEQRRKEEEEKKKLFNKRKMEERKAEETDNPLQAFIELGKIREYQNPVGWAIQRMKILQRRKDQGKKK